MAVSDMSHMVYAGYLPTDVTVSSSRELGGLPDHEEGEGNGCEAENDVCDYVGRYWGSGRHGRDLAKGSRGISTLIEVGLRW